MRQIGLLTLGFTSLRDEFSHCQKRLKEKKKRKVKMCKKNCHLFIYHLTDNSVVKGFRF